MTLTPKIATLAQTQAILKRHGFRFKKSLGQNFLTEPKILERIVSAAQVSEDDDVIEIGPGIGALTQYLADAAHHVLAVEIDERLQPILAETLAEYPNAEVEVADILKSDLNQLITDHFDGQYALKVVANLPYYITTPILLHLLQTSAPLKSITVMMQKEVADRLVALPGTKDYGSLSIAVQMKAHVDLAFTVSRKAFVPAPNVDSAIVTLTMRTHPPVEVADPALFDRIVRGAFASRRKTLWNNMQNLFGKTPAIKAQLTAAFNASEISPQRRGESLSLSEFAQLTDVIAKQGLAKL